MKETHISHHKGPEAIFLSWMTSNTAHGNVEKGLRCYKTTAPTQMAHQISWSWPPVLGVQLGEGFSIPSGKVGSLLVHFLWRVYTWTEGAQQGCFQGTFRGKPTSQESWMPDVKPVCAAEHAPSKMHRHQILVWGDCCPDLGPFLSCRQGLEEIYVI